MSTSLETPHNEDKPVSSVATEKECVDNSSSYNNTIVENPTENAESGTSIKAKLNRDLTFVKTSTVVLEKILFDSSVQTDDVIPRASTTSTGKVDDKCTQIVVEQKDEECNTTNDLKCIDTSTDYVFVNGPLYILKEALSPERGIVLCEDKHVGVDIAPVKEVSPQVSHISSHFPDDTVNLSDYSLLTNSSLNFMNNFNSSLLLHSDYDLTPQKDDAPNKYHYLMVDVSTSISNANIGTQKNDFLAITDSHMNQTVSTDIKVNNSDTPLVAKEHKSNLLAKSEEYLLKPPVELCGELSIDESKTEGMSINSENSSSIPVDGVPMVKKQITSKFTSLPSHHIDLYKVGQDRKKSSDGHTRLRRHRSLQ